MHYHETSNNKITHLIDHFLIIILILSQNDAILKK